METLQFSILIDADAKTTWDTMLKDPTYREWTREFCPGSHFQGTWYQGSEMRFLAPNEKGEMEGMISVIKENIAYQFISIEHLGLIKKGEVDTTSAEVRKWAPSFENYRFDEQDGKTELRVEVEVDPEYKSMFEEMWPRALVALKALCEKR